MTHPLAKYAPVMRDPDPDGAEKFAAHAWHRDGSVAFTAKQLSHMDWQDRDLIKAIAVRFYGERR